MTSYFHTIAPCGCEYSDCSHVHEARVIWTGSVYVQVDEDPQTGRRHELYFDSLREWVIWHYQKQGFTINDQHYPFEKEVKKFHLPQDTPRMLNRGDIIG